MCWEILKLIKNLTYMDGITINDSQRLLTVEVLDIYIIQIKLDFSLKFCGIY